MFGFCPQFPNFSPFKIFPLLGRIFLKILFTNKYIDYMNIHFLILLADVITANQNLLIKIMTVTAI